MTKAFLFPSGSSNEKKEGISHLFEHILIKKVKAYFGFTTEDYFIIFANDLSDLEMEEGLKRMEINTDELQAEKDLVIKEIDKKKYYRGEIFFRNIWKDFRYSRSPIGKKQDVQNISMFDIGNFKKKTIETGFISTNNKSKIRSFNKLDHEYNYKANEITLINKKVYKNYSIIFLKNGIEHIYLLERILRLKNPTRYIQLSEKKDLSALIIQRGSIFPDLKELIRLKEFSQKQILHEVSLIETNFYNRAINELESFYFYNLSWQKRIAKFSEITNFNIINIYKKIESFNLL